jgi:hypothetical protein
MGADDAAAGSSRDRETAVKAAKEAQASVAAMTASAAAATAAAAVVQQSESRSWGLSASTPRRAGGLMAPQMQVMPSLL